MYFMFLFLATLRSGYMLQDSAEFAQTVEELMRETLGIPKDLGVSKMTQIICYNLMEMCKSAKVSQCSVCIC